MYKEKISILVVDNNPLNIKDIKRVLIKNGNVDYNIDTAFSTVNALEKAETNKFHLALLEHNPPDIDGIEILDKINKKGLGLPVVMFTGLGNEGSGVEAVKKGAYDYLTREEVNRAVLTRTIQNVLIRKKLEDRVKESYERLESMAIRDGLTGLYNRRYFQEALRNEYKKAKRHMQSLSFIILDIDLFKSVNDSYGHQFGDFVLVQSAKIIEKLVRDTDLVARYGGEEFAVILPNTDLSGALILGERIRNSFAQSKFKKEKVSTVVTASLGVSSTMDSNIITKESLIANADSALYHAKWRGRNNVCAWGEIESESTVSIKEDIQKIEYFYRELKNHNENIKEACIESAQNIFHELAGGWDYVIEHSKRVSHYAEMLSRELSICNKEINVIKRAALLHDIGMVGISLKILKKDKITREEYDLIKRHSNIGVRIMEQTKLFDKELPIILYHHERYDGSGYPHKLKANLIPYGARILAVAEAYDAMVSETTYGRACSSGDAIAELKKCIGSQFDPQLIDAFVKTVDKMV